MKNITSTVLVWYLKHDLFISRQIFENRIISHWRKPMLGNHIDLLNWKRVGLSPWNDNHVVWFDKQSWFKTQNRYIKGKMNSFVIIVESLALNLQVRFAKMIRTQNTILRHILYLFLHEYKIKRNNPLITLEENFFQQHRYH